MHCCVQVSSIQNSQLNKTPLGRDISLSDDPSSFLSFFHLSSVLRVAFFSFYLCEPADQLQRASSLVAPPFQQLLSLICGLSASESARSLWHHKLGNSKQPVEQERASAALRGQEPVWRENGAELCVIGIHTHTHSAHRAKDERTTHTEAHTHSGWERQDMFQVRSCWFLPSTFFC